MDDAVAGAATLDGLGQSARSALDEYVALLEAFLTERLSPTVFESRSIDLVLSDQRIWPGSVYETLNEVFLDRCVLRRFRDSGPQDRDEEQLRATVAAAVTALRQSSDRQVCIGQSRRRGAAKA